MKAIAANDLILRAANTKTVFAHQHLYSTKNQQPVATELLLREVHGVTLGDFIKTPGKFVEQAQAIVEGKIQAIQSLIYDWPNHVYFVNFTPDQIASPDFITLIKLFTKAKITASSVAIEVTEDKCNGCEEKLIENIRAARKLGFSIVVDDFTKGQSNLLSLISFDPTIVKIDMNMIQASPSSIKHKRLLCATVRLIHEMGMKCVIEGVETQEQFDFARIAGADFMQGYFLSKPEIVIV